MTPEDESSYRDPAATPPVRTPSKTPALSSSSDLEAPLTSHGQAQIPWESFVAGLAVGVGLGYLLFFRRPPDTFREVVSDSLAPWASRNVHEAVARARQCNPLGKVTAHLKELRAS